MFPGRAASARNHRRLQRDDLSPVDAISSRLRLFLTDQLGHQIHRQSRVYRICTSKAALAKVNIERNAFQENWNYAIKPTPPTAESA